MVSYGDDVFPNLRVAIQIILTIAVSIASCERSFNKLKLILSYLRASMGQERLSALAILSIERETLEKIDLDHDCRSVCVCQGQENWVEILKRLLHVVFNKCSVA